MTSVNALNAQRVAYNNARLNAACDRAKRVHNASLRVRASHNASHKVGRTLRAGSTTHESRSRAEVSSVATLLAALVLALAPIAVAAGCVLSW